MLYDIVNSFLAQDHISISRFGFFNLKWCANQSNFCVFYSSWHATVGNFFIKYDSIYNLTVRNRTTSFLFYLDIVYFYFIFAIFFLTYFDHQHLLFGLFLKEARLLFLMPFCNHLQLLQDESHYLLMTLLFLRVRLP